MLSGLLNKRFVYFCQLGYLRRFKKLKTLNMSGNQFEEIELYKLKVIAYLPNLEFLDYRLIDEQSVSTGLSQNSVTLAGSVEQHWV